MEDNRLDNELTHAEIEEMLRSTFEAYMQVDDAFAICCRVLEMEQATASHKARALLSRPDTYLRRKSPGDFDLAIDDLSTVLGSNDAPEEIVMLALFSRATAYADRDVDGDAERAIADYTTSIERSGGTGEHARIARYNRAISYICQNDEHAIQLAIDDYTCIIEDETAPAQILALALQNRAHAYAKRMQDDDREKLIADFARMVELEDAPVEIRLTPLRMLIQVMEAEGNLEKAAHWQEILRQLVASDTTQ